MPALGPGGRAVLRQRPQHLRAEATRMLFHEDGLECRALESHADGAIDDNLGRVPQEGIARKGYKERK